jgi:hypothetical protein
MALPGLLASLLHQGFAHTPGHVAKLAMRAAVSAALRIKLDGERSCRSCSSSFAPACCS